MTRLSASDGDSMTRLVAVDWGTTSLRGARLGADAEVLEERSFPRGILSVPAGGFRAAFDAAFGDWMAAGALCLIAGMAGSRQGWIEAPYCACPAGFAEVASALAWVEPGRIGIVAGLSCEHGGVPDVMRGEETQVFGALQLLGLDDALCVLPGTHNKWVEVRGRRIEGFTTAMTGEFYALLRQHSILGRTMPAEDGPLHEAAFDAGIAFARRGPGLLQTAFSARTLALFDRMPAAQLPSYLSGLVIGEELRSQQSAAGLPLVLIGSEALTQRYMRALGTPGADLRRVGALATWRGLWEIAQVLGRRGIA
jgi:2-dehydro-3-deoxygalactonokinase